MKNNSRFNNFFAIGSVVVEGGSSNIQAGQVALCANIGTKDGAKIINPTEIGQYKEDLMFQVGFYGGFKHRGVFFKKEDIKEVKFIKPTDPVQAKVIVGHDGIDVTKTIKFKPGETKQINLTLENPIFQLIEGLNSDCIKLSFPVTSTLSEDDCEMDTCAGIDCRALIEEAVSKMQNWKVGTSLKLSDLVKIRKVISCTGTPTTITTEDATFYTLEICDEGDSIALGRVQSQTGLNVSRVDRSGSNSTYQVLVAPTAVAPTTYTAYNSNIDLECDECKVGYTKVESGYQYTVSLEDEGADDKATVETLVNAIPNSARKVSQSGGFGTYIVLLSSVLQDADRDTFVLANPTSDLENNGFVEGYCVADSNTVYNWVSGSSCKVAKDEYTIYLRDTDCGTSRLVELQKAYPSLTIEEVVGSEVNCSRQYKTSVYTNIVCDECNTDSYSSTAPLDFTTIKWTKTVTSDSLTDCLCGIEFEGIPLTFFPSACHSDRIASFNSATKIYASVGQKTTGGYIHDTENLSEAPVTIVSVAYDGTGYGYQFIDKYNRQLRDVSGKTVTDNSVAELLGIGHPFEMGKQYTQVSVIYNSRFADNTGRSKTDETVSDNYVLLEETPAILDFFNSFNR